MKVTGNMRDNYRGSEVSRQVSRVESNKQEAFHNRTNGDNKGENLCNLCHRPKAHRHINSSYKELSERPTTQDGKIKAKLWANSSQKRIDKWHLDIRKCSTSLTIREMQIQTIVKSRFVHVRWVKMKRVDNSRFIIVMWWTGQPTYSWEQ